MATRNRQPQLPLGLDTAAADPGARWCDGARIAFLGGSLILRLGTDRRETVLEGGELHLPLPPGSTERQIRDAAESWLRRQALAVIAEQVRCAASVLGRPAPSVTLSFSARGGWAEADDRGILRCHWRLIEQPRSIIAEVIRRAVAALPPATAMPDLFGGGRPHQPRRSADAKRPTAAA